MTQSRVKHEKYSTVATSAVTLLKRRESRGVGFWNIRNWISLLIFLGVELQICPQGPTCCTRAMETRLGEWSSQQYRKALKRRTDQMAAPFKAKATQLDGKKSSSILHFKKWFSGSNLCTNLQKYCWIKVKLNFQSFLQKSFYGNITVLGWVCLNTVASAQWCAVWSQKFHS